MSGRFDNVAYVGLNLIELRHLVEDALGLVLEPRYSDEWGGDYWSTPLQATPEVFVTRNFPDEDGVHYIEGHPEYTGILFSAGLTSAQSAELTRRGGTPLDAIIIVAAELD